MEKRSKALERRVVEALAGAGLVRRSRPLSSVTASFAVGLLVGAGALLAVHAGDRSGNDGADGNYLLALYSTPTYRAAAEERERATEYAAWARQSGKGNAAVAGGMELGQTVATLGPSPNDPRQLAGFFSVQADTAADAVALASTSPHLRHGGTVIVRSAGN